MFFPFCFISNSQPCPSTQVSPEWATLQSSVLHGIFLGRRRRKASQPLKVGASFSCLLLSSVRSEIYPRPTPVMPDIKISWLQTAFPKLSQLQDSGISNPSFTRNSANNICAAPRTKKHGQEAFTNPGCVNCFWECLQMILPENVGGFWWKLIDCGMKTTRQTFPSFPGWILELKRKRAISVLSHHFQAPHPWVGFHGCTVWIEQVLNLGFTPKTSSVAPHGMFIAWKSGIWEEKRGGRRINSIFPSRITLHPQLSTEICYVGTFSSQLW